MKYSILMLALAVVILAVSTPETWARGGFGGGGRASFGGGGGARMGGGGASFSRSPSMSRSMPRPATTRPATRPSINRPSTSQPTFTRPGGSTVRPNIGGNAGASRPNLPTRPGTVGGGDRPNFGSNRPGGSSVRPSFGGDRPNAGSYNRPSGQDLSNFLDLPGKPTTLPGRTANLPNRPTTLPGNLPGRPGGGVRPNLPDRGDRPNIDNRPNINRPDVGDINIGNKISIDRENNINSIRNKWNNVDQRPFGRDWWDTHHHLPNDPHWRWHSHWDRYPNHWCWRPCTWGAFGTWFAWSWAQPYTYDYGNTVVYQDDYVYVNNQQYATTEQYYQQADTIAESVPADANPDDADWMPLGVFAITEQSATDTNMMLQLAVSKEGIIAGTFYNQTTDSSRPVEGTVDQKSQRAAWKFADEKNPEIVMEAGIYDLTQDQTTALVHFGEEKSQTWLMVRLPPPDDQK